MRASKEEWERVDEGRARVKNAGGRLGVWNGVTDGLVGILCRDETIGGDYETATAVR